MFDRVIVSSDESHFKDFWPIVATSWKKFFPNKKACLAFVSDRDENDPLVLNLKKWGEVYLFPIQKNIPTANQAKMYRYILAGQFDNDVCMIEDIDTIPLQTNFINRILSFRKKNELLRVGSEVYKGTKDEGKFPTSNLTAESYIFKKLLNPNNLNYEELFKSWIDINVFDKKESVNNFFGKNYEFSDESLMRVLINTYSPSGNNICEIERNVDIKKDWIDRSWWKIDEYKLKNNDYVICNFLRPFVENYKKIEPIVKFIFDNENISQNEILINV
jgi:hypothetical protein